MARKSKTTEDVDITSAEVTETGSATAETAVATMETQEEKKFPLERLAVCSLKLFGVPSSTFAGATASLDPDGKYSKSEVAEVIAQWKEKEAK